MNIPGLDVGFDYTGSYIVPKEIMGDFGDETEDIIKLNLEYLNPTSMKGESRDYYLAYENKEAKRVAFRAMKLQIAALTLLKSHRDINKVSSEVMMGLVQESAKVYNIELNGILAFQQIKDLIMNDLIKEVDYNLLPYYRVKLFDIQKHQDYSKVGLYEVRARYRRN